MLLALTVIVSVASVVAGNFNPHSSDRIIFVSLFLSLTKDGAWFERKLSSKIIFRPSFTVSRFINSDKFPLPSNVFLNKSKHWAVVQIFATTQIKTRFHMFNWEILAFSLYVIIFNIEMKPIKLNMNTYLTLIILKMLNLMKAD